MADDLSDSFAKFRLQQQLNELRYRGDRYPHKPHVALVRGFMPSFRVSVRLQLWAGYDPHLIPLGW